MGLQTHSTWTDAPCTCTGLGSGGHPQLSRVGCELHQRPWLLVPGEASLHVPLVQHLWRKTLPQGGHVGQSWVFLPGTMCWAQVFPCSSTLCQQWYHPDAPLWSWEREVSIPGQRGTSTVPVVHQLSFCPYMGGEGRGSVRGSLAWLPHLPFGC